MIHLKSSVNGKIPTAEQLNYGEIAINYAKDSEAIFFKNSENNVVEIKTNSAVVEELNTKQDKTDNTLATTDKTVVGAINEVNTKFTNLAVGTTNLADNAVTKEKLSTDVQSSLDKADNSLQKGNVAAPTSDTDAVNKSYVDGKTENLITNDDSLNLNVPIIIYTSTDDDSIAANKANISFYLKFWEKYTLRITDTTFGDTNIRRPSNICFIPTIVTVSKSNNNFWGTGIIFGYIGEPDISYYHGIFRVTSSSDSTHNGSYKIVSINANTGKLESASQLISANISYSKFNTTAKDIFGAINEVNTLAKSKGNGTITEVKMNGASKGTSGAVDLGTVLTEHQSLKTINGETITGSGNVDISAPIYVVPMVMSTEGYPIPDSSKIDTNKLSVYMKSGYTVIGKPVDSSAPIVSFITGNNGYHYHYFDEKKGMMIIRVYGNNLSQHEIEYDYQFTAPQDSGSTGVCGGVPVPTYDDKEKFLKGDGTWSEVKTIDNDYYLPVSAFSGQTAVTQDVLDAIVDVRDSQGKKHLYIYDESAALGTVAEVSVANFFGKTNYYISWMSYYGDYYNTIWAYRINSGSKEIVDVSFRLGSFKGSTTSASGKKGIVPAPTTADTESFLCGNGEWKKVSGGSSAFVLDPNNYKFSELVDAVFANKIIMLKDFLFFSNAYSVIAAPMDGDGSIVTTVAETKDVYCAFIYIGATQGRQVTQVTAIKFTGDNTWTAEPNSAGQLLCTDDYKVDTAMSDTSINPVQNKVIKAYIDGLVGNVAAQLAQI